MKEIKKHLEEAFQLASSIPVKGDAVDVMAVVRANLKNAYRLLEEKEAEATEPSCADRMDRSEGEKPKPQGGCFKPESEGSRALRIGEA